MGKFTESREMYLERRFKGESRAEIAASFGITVNALYYYLEKWHIQSQKDEDAVLADMRRRRPGPPTSSSPIDTGSPMAPMQEPPTSNSVAATLDLSGFEWVGPSCTRMKSPVAFGRKGIRISETAALHMKGCQYVEVGFKPNIMVMRPTSESSGWRLKVTNHAKGFLVGAERLIEAAKKVGFKVGMGVEPVWDKANNVLVCRVPEVPK